MRAVIDTLFFVSPLLHFSWKTLLEWMNVSPRHKTKLSLNVLQLMDKHTSKSQHKPCNKLAVYKAVEQSVMISIWTCICVIVGLLLCNATILQSKLGRMVIWQVQHALPMLWLPECRFNLSCIFLKAIHVLFDSIIL